MAGFARRYAEFMQRNHDKIIALSSVIGANIGVYMSMTSDTSDRDLEINNYAFGVFGGGIVGGMVGVVSPIAAPIFAVGAPGYLLAKGRIAQLELKQKAETRVEVKRQSPFS